MYSPDSSKINLFLHLQRCGHYKL